MAITWMYPRGLKLKLLRGLHRHL